MVFSTVSNRSRATFGIFSPIPVADGENAIRVRVRDNHGLYHESGLLLQNGQDLFIDDVGKYGDALLVVWRES
jgi:hypothetical protein